VKRNTVWHSLPLPAGLVPVPKPLGREITVRDLHSGDALAEVQARLSMRRALAIHRIHQAAQRSVAGTAPAPLGVPAQRAASEAARAGLGPAARGGALAGAVCPTCGRVEDPATA
jgi:hypothetical protein